MGFAINPPNAPLVDQGGYCSPTWYRWFARVQNILGDDAISAIIAAPALTYSPTTAFSDDKVLTAGAGMSFTSAATTFTIALTVTGVTAAAYGSASQVPSFTVDQYGRLSAAANVTITPAAIGAVPTTRTLTAGAGLTGGGDLSADRTFDVGAGTGIIVNANDVALDTANTRNTDHAAVTLTAGAGLTGGGDISASRTFNIGAGSGITVNADDIQIDTAVVATLTGAQTLTNKTMTLPVLTTSTVAGLPAAGVAGRKSFVTDATATTFASIVAGGGANGVPVYDDGTNWRIG